jgi:hypothetical protein
MNKTELYVGMLPSAVDLWCAVIAMCEIFDKRVPFWVWVMLVIEVVLAISKSSQLKSMPYEQP